MSAQAARWEALADALTALFGLRLGVETSGECLNFSWDGRRYGSLCMEGMDVHSVASAALSTAHDVVLEGMGESGEHPGAWASAHCEAVEEGDGLTLLMLAADGTVVAESHWKNPLPLNG